MTSPTAPAPYPEHESDVTADVLARAHTVAGQRAWLRLYAGPDRLYRHPGGPMWRYWLASLVGEFRAAWLLRALAEHAPQAADQVARDLWLTLDEGEPVGEQLHAWLTAAGIDPDQVAPVVEAEADATGLQGWALRVRQQVADGDPTEELECTLAEFRRQQWATAYAWASREFDDLDGTRTFTDHPGARKLAWYAQQVATGALTPWPAAGAAGPPPAGVTDVEVTVRSDIRVCAQCYIGRDRIRPLGDPDCPHNHRRAAR